MQQVRLLPIFMILLLGVASQKEDDEGRPYEFSFTIDGEQHRYEKKDVNGIIQGEFGFITADGVYHVTVYATDENGSFKILSMRNVKISEPLDKGGVPSTKGLVGQKGTVAQSAPLIEQPRVPDATLPPVVTSTARPLYDFTTASTIRNGCGGCGIVTKSPPGPLQFQHPAFKDFPRASSPSPELGPFHESKLFNDVSQQPNYDIDVRRTSADILHPGQYPPKLSSTSNPPFSNTPEIFLQFSGGPSTVGPVDFVPAKLNDVEVFATPVYEREDLSTAKFFGSTTRSGGRSLDISKNAVPAVSNDAFYPTGNPLRPVSQYQELRNELPNQIPFQPESVLSRIQASNGLINIPGKSPIPIKDKYPNMVDGLPDGISEKDVTNLLYKFNYTVGFHGHYEKGLKNGAKIGGYFVNGRDGISRVVTYVADENGYRPKFTLINIGLDSEDTPKPDSEKTFGLKNFEFVWYPLD